MEWAAAWLNLCQDDWSAMNNFRVRLVAILVLILGTTTAKATLLSVAFSGPTPYPSEDWTGPGPAPASFDLSLTFDTSSSVSSDLTYLGNGGVSSYRFYGVEVISVSFIANGAELWSDPSGLTLDFGGDDAGGGGQSCFCYVGYTPNLLGQSVGISYADILPLQSQLGTDPLAAILLAQGLINSDVNVVGEWGHVRGYGAVTVSVVPLPPTVWLLATGWLGAAGWAARKSIRFTQSGAVVR